MYFVKYLEYDWDRKFFKSQDYFRKEKECHSFNIQNTLYFFLISQLHKLVTLYDTSGIIKKLFTLKPASAAKAGTTKRYMVLTQAQKQICRQYNLLAQTMDDVISLPKLLRMAKLSKP